MSEAKALVPRAAPGESSADPLPNPLPRPPEELETLERVWAVPQGWRLLSAVNNTQIGLFYLATAFLFFLLAGMLALIMRAHLAAPEAGLVGPGTYNQLFTMHGTVMMFLFAVPAVEALGVYLIPNMLGARDLPFPRLSAYAFWAYFFGGLAFFSSLFFGLAPDAGWFLYPPLSSIAHSPGINVDFWLLGIGFIEISAIAGAIEIIVGILKTRAPGMTLDRMPIYAWAMLVFAALIIFAFPAVIVGTLLLELERALGWPFFIAEKGGSPLLWQHLFWFFGHPEVYIIFLPAAGAVSMMVPTLARTPLVGYRLVVLSLIAAGFLSFGVWVHHMFATGIPALSLSFFSAASLAVSIPSGIQVFAWIATIASGRLTLTTPALFVLGFLVTFTLGGLTGVMLAMVPFDWQAHDTYFVVAHLHYVLIGGMVFPLFAAFYYWAPQASSRPLSEQIGRWVFALMFAGVHITFFPMHIAGLAGMPRRIHTYPPEAGWAVLNVTSTAGAVLIALGVLLFLLDLMRNFRPGRAGVGNVWGASTLEWVETGPYGLRSIPVVRSREPLWDDPNLARDVVDGRYLLPGTATGGRETIVTSPGDAEPQYLLVLPGPAWSPFWAALFTAAFFILLTVKAYAASIICGAFALAGVLIWLWDTEPQVPRASAEIGESVHVPVGAAGSVGHAWWAMIVLLIVIGMMFASLVFTYLFLWSVAPRPWPPEATLLPSLSASAGTALLYLASSALIWVATRHAARTRLVARGSIAGLIAGATALLVAAVATDVWGHLEAGIDPRANAYGATIASFTAFQGVLVATLTIFALFVAAKLIAHRLDERRRAAFDSLRLLWHFTVAQGLLGLALIAGLPQLVSAP